MYSRLYLVKTKTKCFVVLADTLKTVSSFIDGGLEEGGGGQVDYKGTVPPV